MRLSLGMPVQFGPIKGMVFGGPFREYVPGTRRLVGVKMAAEIDHPHDISIPTHDFSIPDDEEMMAGMLAAITALHKGNDIYAGCMGGIGRTGLFMGCMAKLMADWEMATNEDGGLDVVLVDPVKYVRHHYKSHAIETQEQQSFVRGFNTDEAVVHLQDLLGCRVKEPEVQVAPKVEEVRLITAWDWMTNPVMTWLRLWK